jgi:hypothetical protein
LRPRVSTCTTTTQHEHQPKRLKLKTPIPRVKDGREKPTGPPQLVGEGRGLVTNSLTQTFLHDFAVGKECLGNALKKIKIIVVKGSD